MSPKKYMRRTDCEVSVLPVAGPAGPGRAAACTVGSAALGVGG